MSIAPVPPGLLARRPANLASAFGRLLRAAPFRRFCARIWAEIRFNKSEDCQVGGNGSGAGSGGATAVSGWWVWGGEVWIGGGGE